MSRTLSRRSIEMIIDAYGDDQAKPGPLRLLAECSDGLKGFRGRSYPDC
jgi:hypothetical protein